ncbi:MAG: anhydro-N-acetylmuramic acid kinase [Acidobacteria bacterium 13_1_40CM_2_68_10]|nr:MAG: anhydro-N-acetylmuramic acid kinase [Acidobacteria bacterium 13_1_40CM_2_68_10]OLE64832.1 MAG: anhydro-N-acetylmuramic acid kinase [Acidobacteria bacterium 13_1_20CM_2_68_14]
MIAGLTTKPERLVVGIMSGTSADGVDAALLQIRGTGEALSWRLLRHETLHYSVKVRDLIRRCSEPGSGDAASICRLNVLLGELFARAVTHVAERAGVEPKSIDLIGSHGQTLQNLPGPVTITGITVRSSLQVGEPAVIAERTGVTTVANFRARDLAAGGQGSPLESYVDFLLFRNRSRGRLVINIGGVASLTAIPANAAADRVRGFDSGPGNMVIDGLVAHMTGGREAFDHGGRYGRKGKSADELLARLLDHPYLLTPPPKSCGREEFGRPFLESILKENAALPPNDLIATATRFTAESIAFACRRYVMPHNVYEEAIVSGGGARNDYLMEQLRAAIPELSIKESDEYGLPAAAKEAAAFALLANEAIHGTPNNLPTVTGAARAVVLGTIVFGRTSQ